MKYLVTLLIVVSTNAILAQKQWNLDLTKAKIEWNKYDDSAEGTIGGLNATVKMDPENPDNASINARVDVKTLNSGIDERDEHLMKAEFFNAEKHPAIRFKSNKVVKTETGYLAYGTLEIAGVKEDLKMPFILDGSQKAFIGRMKIDTSTFGVKENKAEKDFNTVIRITLPYQ